MKHENAREYISLHACLECGRLWVQSKLWNRSSSEEFEDTKGVIRIRKSKERHHNGKMKKYKQRST